jgi:endonuclease/exonuclease/phosphatase family metal-dependent hydrolase
MRLAPPIAALAAFLALAAPAAAKPLDVTVMTRNMYLGTDLIPIALAEPGDPFEQAVAKGYQDAQATRFALRAQAVAREIARTKPDVVGFQELTSWTTGPKGDPGPATQPAFDHLTPLLKELTRLGQPYSVVKGGGGIDLEGPSSLGFDIRISEDESLILVRKGVRVVRRQAQPFNDLLKVDTKALGPVTAVRSWSALDLVKGGVRFRVVNTHLEAYSPATRLAQAKELVAGPLRSKLPVILVGDLNSGPTLPKTDDRPPYQALAQAGFVPRRSTRFSCCSDDLKAPTFDHNVDWIMSKPALKLVGASLTGLSLLPEGIFPSDHGGVVSTLRLRR